MATTAAQLQETRVTTFFRSFTLLAGTSLAVVAGIAFLCTKESSAELLGLNAWSSGARNRVVLTLVLVWGLCGAVSLGAIRWGREALLKKLVDRLLWLVPVSFLPVLFSAEYWFSRPVPFLLLLGGVGCFLCLPCFRASLASASSSVERLVEGAKRLETRFPHLPLLIVSGAALIYALYSGTLNVWKHQRFMTGAYDMAIFDNLMWNAMHGEPFQSSIMYNVRPGNSLAGHAEFAMLLFTPLYAVYPSAEILLWLQASCMALGSVTLFLFAQTQIGSWSSVILSLVYLFYAPNHGAQSYDFHWLTLATPFLFLLFYGIARTRVKLVIATTLFLWLLREDIAPGLVIVGLFLVLSGQRVRWGALLAIGSALWFVCVKFLIMPAFGHWFFADLYAELGTPTEKGYASVVKTLLTNPTFVFQRLLTEGKLIYLLHILAPLAFIPFRRASIAALLIPGAFFTILTNWQPAISIAFQYSTHFTAYVFTAVVLFLKGTYFGEKRDRAGLGATLLTIVFCVACHSAVYGNVIQPSSFIGAEGPFQWGLDEEQKQRLEGTRRLVQMIPTEASVIATTRESSHVSSRAKVYSFGHSRVPAEYMLLHPASFPLGSTQQDIRALLRTHAYGFVAREGDTTLWRKEHVSERTEEELNVLRRQLKISKSTFP